MTPRDNPHLHGHEAAERLMRDAADGGRLHHAWLLTGPEGIGKATLAYRFARALLAGFPSPLLGLDPAHPVFRRVAAGSHPDVLTLTRPWDEKKRALKAEIPVDDARALAGFLALTAAEGGWRVVVVDGAEHLNRNAANAVLKLLEEPPPKTVLVLTASAPGRLLPTIRSRCRRLPLRPLDERAVEAVLREVAPELDEAHRRTLAQLGDGSPGVALGWRAEGHVALDEAARALVERAVGAATGQGAAFVDDALADLALKTEGGPAHLTQALQAALAAHVRRALRQGAPDPAIAGLCEAWGAIDALDRQAVRFNLDRRQAILASLHTVRRP